MGISGDDTEEGSEMKNDVYLSDQQVDTSTGDPDLFHQL